MTGTPPLLFLVTGLPASGKTTAARVFSERFGLPCLHKDDLKEPLLERLGTGDRAWSRQVGAACIDLLWQLAGTFLERGVSLIIECPFDPRLARGQLEMLAQRTRFELCQIECRAGSEALIRRFSERLTERHPDHMDGNNLEEHRNVARLNPSLMTDWPGLHIVLDTESARAEDLIPAIAPFLTRLRPPSPLQS